jgi:predicted RNase H-like nuclease (RuvC/YqgF family)
MNLDSQKIVDSIVNKIEELEEENSNLRDAIINLTKELENCENELNRVQEELDNLK